jgi:hypothetical protein
MPTCVQSLQSHIGAGTLGDIEQISSGVPFSINMTSSIKQLIRVSLSQQQIALFTIALQSAQPPTNIGVTITFYQVNGSQIINLGSAQITEMTMSFQKDFVPGEYYICIGSAVFTYTGTLTGQFTGFPPTAILKPYFYAGEAILPINAETPPGIRVCNKLLYFEILDGILPPGLVMTQLGKVYGILPNMDCIDENADLSPSQNWYYEDESTWQPWGRQWRFKVRVWIAIYPQAWADEWFCIKIYNNWSWDKDNFIPPFEYEVEDEIPLASTDPSIPNQICCEEVEPPPFKLTPITPTLCPCESETPTEKAIQLNFLQWYHTILLNPPGDANPDMQRFIDNFRQTDYYKTMIINSGLEETLYTPQELELKAVEELIGSFIDKLDAKGRAADHLDQIMFEMKDEVNQSLPITIEARYGEHFTCHLESQK